MSLSCAIIENIDGRPQKMHLNNNINAGHFLSGTLCHWAKLRMDVSKIKEGWKSHVTPIHVRCNDKFLFSPPLWYWWESKWVVVERSREELAFTLKQLHAITCTLNKEKKCFVSQNSPYPEQHNSTKEAWKTILTPY